MQGDHQDQCRGNVGRGENLADMNVEKVAPPCSACRVSPCICMQARVSEADTIKASPRGGMNAICYIGVKCAEALFRPFQHDKVHLQQLTKLQARASDN
jgi:hypothetical protein